MKFEKQAKELEEELAGWEDNTNSAKQFDLLKLKIKFLQALAYHEIAQQFKRYNDAKEKYKLID